jgi:hypothetical protein
MTRRGNRAYVGATLVRQARLTRPDGTVCFLREYRGSASRGFRSDFERLPTRWLVLTYPGGREETWTYSGARLPAADKNWSESLAAIKAAGGSAAEEPLPGRSR